MSALPIPPLPGGDVDQQPPRRYRWERIILWTMAALVLLVVAVTIALVVYVRSSSGQQFILTQIQKSASESLGAPVTAQSSRLDLGSKTLTLYGVTIASTGMPSPPLMQVERMSVSVKITSFLHRKYHLGDIQVVRPVVKVVVLPNGQTNLPKPPQKQTSSETGVFDLGVEHAQITRGEIYYNDRPQRLDADLRNLEFQATLHSGPRYTGSLSYSDGHIHYGAYNPLPHALQATFTATPSRFTLDKAILSSGGSNFTVNATLEDYSRPVVRAQYQAVMAMTELRRVMKNTSLPVGTVNLAGTLQYRQENRPLLESMVLQGDVTSSGLRVHTPKLTTDLRELRANYRVANGNAEVTDLRALVLGGVASGTLKMVDVAGKSRSNAELVVSGISAKELKKVAGPQVKDLPVNGVVDAHVTASWGKTMNDLVADAEITMRGTLGQGASATQALRYDGRNLTAGDTGDTGGSTGRAEVVALHNPRLLLVAAHEPQTTGASQQQPASPAAQSGTGATPFTGHIRLHYRKGQIAVEPSTIQTPHGAINLKGGLGPRSTLDLNLQGVNLHYLQTVLQSTLKTKTASLEQLGLYGIASFTGKVRNATSAPNLVGRLTITNLQIKETTWPLLRTDVNLSPSEARLQNGLLEAVPQGRASFNVQVGLRQWSFERTSPFRVNVQAAQLLVANLARALGVSYPVSGVLNANIAAQGTQLNPVGKGTISLARGKVAGQPVQALNINFQGTGQAVNSTLQIRTPAGNADGKLAYFPREQGYELQFQAPGIALEKLQPLRQRNLDVAGTLTLAASGRGTLANPQLQLTAQVPQLHAANQTLGELKFQTTVANHVADFNLSSAVINTVVRANGKVNLTGNYEANATLDTQAIPLQPLLAAYAPSVAGGIQGQTELHATVTGPLKQPKLLEAHATIPVLSVNYNNVVQLAAPEPIRIDYANRTLQVQRASIRGTDTDLQFQATVPASKTEPASLLLLGTVDLRIAQAFDPTLSSSGQVRFNINSFGERANPNVQGQVEIVNATIATGTVPVGLQNGNGVLTLTKDRLQITRFEGTVGGGTVTASGGVVYRPSLQFDLALAGKDIRLLYPKGVREALDLDLALTGTPQSSLLQGQVRIEELQFTPAFDATTMMAESGGVASPSPASFANHLRLNLGVVSTSVLNPVSSTLSVRAAANLRVQGTAANPVILGRVNLNGGDLVFMGNRYVLEEGTIDFVNAAQTQAVLNVSARTRVQQYDVNLRFEGPLDRLRTNYTSDPSLPPADIINLLAFGKPSEAPALPGSLGAESAVASTVTGQVTSRVSKVAGISQLSVDPLVGCNQQDRGACITIQQRVTSKIFVTFGTDVTSVQREVIRLEYQKSPRLSFSGTRDQNGGFGFDTRIRKTW